MPGLRSEDPAAALQRHLERNGFTRIGVAPAYCNIAGRWQGHIPSRSLTKLGLHRFGRGSAPNFQRLLMAR